MNRLLGITAAMALMMGSFALPAAAAGQWGNPCNPCAMKQSNPCNPCSMKKMQKHNPCNPCSMKKMQKHNPCNPCDMKKMQKHNPCNPCSMKSANPCSAANPCAGMNPCAANPCSAGNTPIRKHAFDNFQQAADAGKKMWNDESLGTSGLSCASCHSGYENLNLDKNQNYPHFVGMVGDVVTLDQMINYCMLNPMKGKQFAQNSKELTAMAAYFRAYRMQFIYNKK